MSDDNQEEFHGDERRRFFRIDDTIRLSYSPVPEEELAQRLERLERGLGGQFTLMSSLAAITTQMAVTLRRIESEDPDIAACLRAMDQKIDLLGRAFLAQEADLTTHPAQAVNLSAGGIAIQGDRPLSVGANLEVKMLLLPSFTGILTYGEVVSCEETPPGSEHRYELRVDFSHIRDQDRDVLIRHVLRRQSDMLRERREARERAEDSDS